MVRLIIWVLVGTWLCSCKPEQQSDPVPTRSINEPDNIPNSRAELIDEFLAETQVGTYIFDKPDFTFVLGANLKEISGLAYDSSDNSLLAVDDESGYYYHLSVDNGKELSKNKFHKKGDYEAITYIDSTVIIAKSSGILYVSKDSTEKSEVLKNQLKSKNDVEGLTYLDDEQVLLIACKGRMIEKDENIDAKAIYSYSLQDKVLSTEPYLIIDIDDLQQYIESTISEQSKYGLKKNLNRIKDFAPSGIAVHGVTKDLYILSARGSSLSIYDKDLNLKNVVLLNSKTIPQPEGICFDKDNNLYISTEGKGFSGKIFKFLYR